MPMTSTSRHPDEETLAAFVDGALPAPKRRRVTEHLASCEDCYEVFAETARFLDEHAQHRKKPASPGRVVPFDRRGLRLPARAWIAAAAVLVVALVGAWLVLRGGPTGPIDPLRATSEEIVTLLNEETREAAVEHLWDETSDALAFSRPSPEARAFSLGVHLVDAQAALEAGDEEAARRSLEAVAEILLDAPATDLSGAASDLVREPKLSDLAALERRLAGEVPVHRLRQGRLVETARLAAAAGSEEFFARPEVQEAFEEMRRQDFSEPARRELERSLTATDPEVMEEALADVIRLEGM